MFRSKGASDSHIWIRDGLRSVDPVWWVVCGEIGGLPEMLAGAGDRARLIVTDSKLSDEMLVLFFGDG